SAPWAENSAAIAADTSSPAAASTAVVWVAAAAWAALSADSIPARSDAAAAVIISGTAITYDIPHLQRAQPNRWLAISDTRIVCPIHTVHRPYAEIRQHRERYGIF